MVGEGVGEEEEEGEVPRSSHTLYGYVNGCGLPVEGVGLWHSSQV